MKPSSLMQSNGAMDHLMIRTSKILIELKGTIWQVE